MAVSWAIIDISNWYIVFFGSCILLSSMDCCCVWATDMIYLNGTKYFILKGCFLILCKSLAFNYNFVCCLPVLQSITLFPLVSEDYMNPPLCYGKRRGEGFCSPAVGWQHCSSKVTVHWVSVVTLVQEVWQGHQLRIKGGNKTLKHGYVAVYYFWSWV